MGSVLVGDSSGVMDARHFLVNSYWSMGQWGRERFYGCCLLDVCVYLR